MLKFLEDPDDYVPSFLQSEQHLADVPGTLMQCGDRTSHNAKLRPNSCSFFVPSQLIKRYTKRLMKLAHTSAFGTFVI